MTNGLRYINLDRFILFIVSPGDLPWIFVLSGSSNLRCCHRWMSRPSVSMPKTRLCSELDLMPTQKAAFLISLLGNKFGPLPSSCFNWHRNPHFDFFCCFFKMRIWKCNMNFAIKVLCRLFFNGIECLWSLSNNDLPLSIFLFAWWCAIFCLHTDNFPFIICDKLLLLFI